DGIRHRPRWPGAEALRGRGAARGVRAADRGCACRAPEHENLGGRKPKASSNPRAPHAGVVRLLIGVVGRAHQGTDGGVAKAHLARGCLELSEDVLILVALDRQMVWRRLLEQAYCQHVQVVYEQTAYDF